MLGSAIAAGVLAVGLSLAGATAAQATPSGCATGFGTDNKAYGNCSSGTGQYRLGIPCKTVLTAFTAYGPWSNVGQASSVGCPFGSWLWMDVSPSGPSILVEKRN
jgi:hypothetical protein